MQPLEDEQLVAATLRGDSTAFEGLVERYQKPLYNAAFRITGNREDALEATQSGFLKSYDKLSQFDPRHRFFSWIFRIVVNESLDIVKQRGRWSEDEPADQPSARRSPEKDVSLLEASDRVHAALQLLSPPYRTVVVLRHFHELSYREISEMTDVPEKTVKSRLFSARRELKTILIDSGLVS